MGNHRKINRAKLRGKPLDEDCKRAITTTHEYGADDNRVHCFGLYANWSNCEIDEKCLKCGAYVDNSSPLLKREV